MANALAGSHLDYRNSLLYGFNKPNIAKLQKVENAPSPIVYRLDKMSHVTLFVFHISYYIISKYSHLIFNTMFGWYWFVC